MKLDHQGHIHHHMVTDPELTRRLDRIEKALIQIIERLKNMAVDFTRLEQKVTEHGSVVKSVVELLQGISVAVRDAGTDQAKLTELVNRLDAQTAALADAVAANTPAVPTE